MILPALILIPALGALLVAVAPPARARAIALAATIPPLALWAWAAFALYPWASGTTIDLQTTFRWIPALGLSVSLGVDAVAMLLLGLTVLLGPICVVASATAITTRVRTYYAWLLALQAAMTGVFCARDLILFYIFFEFTLIPMFVLISLYGSTNRRRAGVKFFLYTFTGSLVALAGLVYVAWFNAARVPPEAFAGAAQWTFDIGTLETAARLMPLETQRWVFLAMMAGFAVKVPIFPLHTWLPLAHTEAPTAGSVILAGVLLKLGTYGIYRFAIPFAPGAAAAYAPAVAILAVCGILIAGLICWVQTDVKKLVAYSSVAHLGFCVLGLFAFNPAGISGSVLYMINHGLSTGALFLLIGMVYERYHTRSMNELGGLARTMPVWATFMVFFTMASVGLPGLNGFVSEFLCIMGAFQASDAWGSLPGSTGGELGPIFAFAAGLGIIVAAIYLLYMVGRVVFGPLVEPHAHHHDTPAGAPDGLDLPPPLPRDLTPREIGVLVPLAALCLLLGVYPRPLLWTLEGPARLTAGVVHAARERAALGAASPAPHDPRQEARR